MMPDHPIQTDPVQDGLAALQAGDMDGALAGFSAARRNDPANAGLLRAIATLYQRTGRGPEAWSAAETGLALLPEDAAFADARLAAMADCGFHAAALFLARRQAEALPQDAQAQFRLGALLLKCGDADAALKAGRRALTLSADHPDALLMSAEAAFRSGDMAAARTWLDHAVALEPENRSMRMARATILLSLGIWMPGLEDYEYRLQPGGAEQVIRTGLSLPRWQQQDLRDGTLLVIAEQGVGDQMRFLRDIIALQPFCGRLIVECARRLTPLFRRSLPPAVIVATAQEQRSADGRHRFDYAWLAGQPPATAYIEMGSLALRLHERGLPPDRPSGRSSA